MLLIAGDGAFGLNGMEMETAVRFGLPMTVIIGNDGGWGQIRNPQLSFFGAERAVGDVAAVHALRPHGRGARRQGRARHRARARSVPPSRRRLGSDDVCCINVVLDPAAYRRTGQVSMAI